MDRLFAAWSASPQALRGIAFMVLSTLGFSGMHVLIRYISDEIPPIEIAFFRNFFGLIVFVPWLMRYGIGSMRTNRLPMHVLRSLLNVVAMFAFFTALSLTPIARVDGARLHRTDLRRADERDRAGRAVPDAALGGDDLWICRYADHSEARPFRRSTWARSWCSDPALLWGVTMIVIKMLARTESSMTITGYMNLLLTLFSLVPAILMWRTPEPGGLVLAGRHRRARHAGAGRTRPVAERNRGEHGPAVRLSETDLGRDPRIYPFRRKPSTPMSGQGPPWCSAAASTSPIANPR